MTKQSDAQRAIADANMAIDSLETIVENLERELMDANDLIARQEKQIADLESERDSLQGELERMEAKAN